MIWYSLPEGILVYTVSAHYLNLHGDQTSGCYFILLCLFAGKLLDWLKREEWSHDSTNRLKRLWRLRDHGWWAWNWTAGWAFLSLIQIRGLDFFLCHISNVDPVQRMRLMSMGMSESVCSAKSNRIMVYPSFPCESIKHTHTHNVFKTYINFIFTALSIIVTRLETITCRSILIKVKCFSWCVDRLPFRLKLYLCLCFCHFKQIIIWQVMWIVAILRCAVGIKESETEMWMSQIFKENKIW